MRDGMSESEDESEAAVFIQSAIRSHLNWTASPVLSTMVNLDAKILT